MTPKGSAKKVLTNEDKVKTRSIIDKEGFLRQHDHSEATKNNVQAFENSSLMKQVTFDYRKVHKKRIC